ncbi:hypothetical protein [Erythrobacter sp. HL-111]|uniref:hypothetical protein n=1 Tax=Erythrobacter sp. HL-111 TaxID=1798193 RepID=UPI0006DA1A97|nr:hypothetical protein [Erythrobacter sp. HL-111]KPP94423.1 MAG: hypothetical protein HLUCCO15_04560 [Erythrobacteraceae bacterium HL-111]SDS56020.1 hypothetical protein SAMN04515621_1790 [Erythrobacter sp. HL-111]
MIAGTNLDILIDDGFAIDTTGVGGDGLQVTTNGGLTLNQVSGSSSIVGDNGFTFTNNAGLVRVRTGGPITGTTGVGISGTHSGDRFDLITVDGDVVGQTRGISVFTSSTSQTEVVTGNVTGLTRYGLIAFENSAGSLRIDTSAGTVFGGTIGVYGRNGGAGNLVIETPPT